MPSRALASLLVSAALSLGGGASAHATIVFGTVTTEPAPAPADAPFTVRLELRDPVDAPVEDAVVHVEGDPQEGELAAPEPDDAEPRVVSDRFEEVAPGLYETTLHLPEPGPWALTFRDRTFRQEEARATVTLAVGPAAEEEPVSFIFPPTATGPQSLTTWLVWLVGLPLVAGAVVTVMVLRNGPSDDEDEADDEADAPDAGDGRG